MPSLDDNLIPTDDDLSPDLGVDDSQDLIEEETKADGTHVRKEIHRMPGGGQTIRITSSGGMMPPGIIGPPPGLMQMIMNDMLRDMAAGSGGPPGGATIRISGGPIPGGTMTVRKTIRTVPDANDDDHHDDDDDGIPPEILEMMRMTDMMIGGGSPFGPMSMFGGPIRKREEKIVRQDESP